MYRSITYIALLTTSLFLFFVGLTTSLMAMHHEGDVVFVKTADNFIVLHDSSSSMSDKYGTTDMLEIEAEQQILEEKVSTLSWFGKGEPVASNETEDGRMKNRRVAIVIADN